MANDKELNPSPKFPQGTYPELSPNPKFENGLVNKTDEKPNGSEETNPQEKPTVFNGDVYVNGSLKVNGKEVAAQEGELPPTEAAQEGDVLQLDSEKKPKWGAISGGVKLYKHNMNLGTISIDIISPDSTPYKNSDFVGTNLEMQEFRRKLILNNEIFLQSPDRFDLKSLSVNYNGSTYYIRFTFMSHISDTYTYTNIPINTSTIIDTVTEL